jgi:hypothetical protein
MLMFVTSYVVAVIGASVLNASTNGDCEAGEITGSACDKESIMRIPLVGPFLSVQPFMIQLWLGGPQILAAVLTVAGIFQASRPVRRSARASFHVYPVPLPAGGMLTATLTL